MCDQDRKTLADVLGNAEQIRPCVRQQQDEKSEMTR